MTEQAKSLLYYLQTEKPNPADLVELLGMYDESQFDDETWDLIEVVGDAAGELDEALTELAERLVEVCGSIWEVCNE